MKITKDIISDLLPLYFSTDCSQDTKSLVEEYLKSDPEFAKQVKQFENNPIPDSIPYQLDNNDEMTALKRTQRLLKMRSFFLGLAIFFSLLPFSFFSTDKITYIFFIESPKSAILYAIIGLGFWIGYFLVKKKSSDI